MRLNAIALVTLGAIGVACSTTQTPGPGQIAERTTVTVENRSLVDLTIYAARGQRIRLGTANASSTTVLVIPPVLLGGAGVIRFIADPIGSSRTSVSEEVSVNKGDDVGLLIPPG